MSASKSPRIPDIARWIETLPDPERYLVTTIIREHYRLTHLHEHKLTAATDNFQRLGSERDGVFARLPMVREIITDERCHLIGELVRIWLRLQPPEQLKRELEWAATVRKIVHQAQGKRPLGRCPAWLPLTDTMGEPLRYNKEALLTLCTQPDANDQNNPSSLPFSHHAPEDPAQEQQQHPVVAPIAVPVFQTGIPQTATPRPQSREEERSKDVAPGQERPRAPRPALADLLQQKDHKWSGIIQDYEDYKELTRQYFALNDKTGRTKVPDCDQFPEDKESQKELARELFEAIVDFSDVIDGTKKVEKKKKNANSGSHRDDDEEGAESDAGEEGDGEAEEDEQTGSADPVHLKRVKALSNLEVELLAWELLFTIHRAQNGVVGFAKWTPPWRYEKCENFWERLEYVKEDCRQSKSIVHGLMVGSFANRLAAAPLHEIRTKLINKELNDARNEKLRSITKETRRSGPSRNASDDKDPQQDASSTNPPAKEQRAKVTKSTKKADNKDDGSRPAKRQRKNNNDDDGNDDDDNDNNNDKPHKGGGAIRAKRRKAQPSSSAQAAPAQPLQLDPAHHHPQGENAITFTGEAGSQASAFGDPAQFQPAHHHPQGYDVTTFTGEAGSQAPAFGDPVLPIQAHASEQIHPETGAVEPGTFAPPPAMMQGQNQAPPMQPVPPMQEPYGSVEQSAGEAYASAAAPPAGDDADSDGEIERRVHETLRNYLNSCDD